MDRRCSYRVSRATGATLPDARWDRPFWRSVGELAIERHMGEEPSHRPRVRARLAWDDRRLYVIFHVEDRYVRSVVREYQGPVSTDSCVEFFCTPGTDTGEGYFNIEVNCGGVVLFMHQKQRGVDRVPMSPEDARELAIAHSMPAVVDPELPGPVEWSIEYQVPYAVLERHAPVVRPGPGVRWMANLYKCADRCSHPHWLTWSPVDRPRPDFHRPEYFGVLEFEG